MLVPPDALSDTVAEPPLQSIAVLVAVKLNSDGSTKSINTVLIQSFPSFTVNVCGPANTPLKIFDA